MTNQEIETYLLAHADGKYRDFHSRLVPGREDIMGVRLPALKTLAKQIARGDYAAFLRQNYADSYEKSMLHGLVIGLIPKIGAGELAGHIREFVPRIDNWAVCDCFCTGLKAVKKYRQELFPLIAGYLDSAREYERRFAIVMLMHYYPDPGTLLLYDRIRDDRYYVRMAIAWGVSVLFVKHRDETLAYLGRNALDDWTHNKAIQKITESRRVGESDKQLVLTLKRRKKQS